VLFLIINTARRRESDKYNKMVSFLSAQAEGDLW
jgi:hypothetical protein